MKMLELPGSTTCNIQAGQHTKRAPLRTSTTSAWGAGLVSKKMMLKHQENNVQTRRHGGRHCSWCDN